MEPTLWNPRNEIYSGRHVVEGFDPLMEPILWNIRNEICPEHHVVE